MIGIFKFVLRTGVIVGVLGAVALGGMTLVKGRAQTAMMLEQAQSHVRTHFEQMQLDTDDPRVLRSQLMQLGEEYPERIGQVRADLEELQREMRETEKARMLSERVAELTGDAVSELEPIVAQAGAVELTSNNAFANSAMIQFEGRVYTIDSARNRLVALRNSRDSHTNAAVDAQKSGEYLSQQYDRLMDIYLRLERERGEFETQLSLLDRQVDAIARNERLIDLMEKRQATFDRYSEYQPVSLEQITQRLNDKLASQEAELSWLADTKVQVDYEDLAREQLQAEQNGFAHSTSAFQYDAATGTQLVPVH